MEQKHPKLVEHPKKPVLAPGAAIGSLVLLTRQDADAHGKAVWLCRCSICGKDKPIRADNLRSGRTKSCGCQQGKSTVGRRNHMSGILPDQGVPPRYRVVVYQSPTFRGPKDARLYRFYAKIYSVDPARPDYWRNDMTRYYICEPRNERVRRGTENRAANNVMNRMAALGWIPRKQGRTQLRWAQSEGVAFEFKRGPDWRDIESAFTDAMKAAHIDLRGQVV